MRRGRQNVHVLEHPSVRAAHVLELPSAGRRSDRARAWVTPGAGRLVVAWYNTERVGPCPVTACLARSFFCG